MSKVLNKIKDIDMDMKTEETVEKPKQIRQIQQKTNALKLRRLTEHNFRSVIIDDMDFSSALHYLSAKEFQELMCKIREEEVFGLDDFEVKDILDNWSNTMITMFNDIIEHAENKIKKSEKPIKIPHYNEKNLD